MLTLELLARPSRRRELAANVGAGSATAPGAPPSHILRPQAENLGAAWWSARARRCRQELPEGLGWAAPLLDPEQPAAVRCGPEQARRLIVRHNHLPTYQQVSFSCERLAHGTQCKPPRWSRPGPAPTWPPSPNSQFHGKEPQ